MFQEIFVKLRFPEGTKIHDRTFAWRKVNFDRLWIKNVVVEDQKEFGVEVSFTSEFSVNYSKEQIIQIMKEKVSFTTGDGMSVTYLKDFDVIEIKEEAEIYGNE